jgi:hypothetical protein
MCFSTAASFAAGAVLSGAAVMAFRGTQKPTQWPFAAIPGIFAIQQFTEGFVWMSLTNHTYNASSSMTAFLFLIFAQVVWPTWIPVAMVLLEKDRWRRQILVTLIGLGMALSVHSLYYLLTGPIEAQISGQHVQYSLNFPRNWDVFIGTIYGIVTIFPLFVSSVRKMWLVGLPIAISFFLAKALYPNYILSVWCYFAAIISVVVIYVIGEMQKDNKYLNTLK